MAKKRRQKLQPRPVRDPNAAPSMRAPAPPADEQFAPSAPPTGMPTANMPPTRMPMYPPEEQGYARGGAVQHRGYASGGDVDPMGYVPDQPMRSAQPQQPQFDPYNLVGRQEPTISPFAAVRPETGYAKGGPIPAAQVPAYTDPVYPPPSAENAKLYVTMDAARERVAHPQPLPSRAPPVWPPQTDPVWPPQTDPHLNRFTQTDTSIQYNPRGYAEGGTVEDGYAPPDDMLAQQQLEEEQRRHLTEQARQGDNSNLRYRNIDYSDGSSPTTARPAGERTGYGSGGEDISTIAPGSPYDPTGSKALRDQEQRPAAAQAQPSTFSQVLDYLHQKFGVGEAQAADNPPPPPPQQTGYTPSAGGYGGDLMEPAPPANAREAAERAPPPAVGAPLSLQSDAPPSISGQNTASVPQAPGSSRLAQVQREIAERPPSSSPDDGLLTKLASVPGALLQRYGDASRLKDAEREQYTGSRWATSDTDTPLMPRIHEGIDKLLRGDRSHTPAEAQQVLKTIQDDPQSPHHNPMVQGTFDTLLKTKGPEEAAAFTQSLRDPYNKLGSIAQVAIANGNWPMAAKFIEQQHNLLPNNQKLTITSGGEGGGFLATVRPEGPGGGAAYSVRLPNADALHKLATEGMQFDSVGKNGLEKTLRGLTSPQSAAPGAEVKTGADWNRSQGLQPGDQPVRPDVDRAGIPFAGGATDERIARGRGGEQLAPRPVGSAAPGTGIAAAPIGTSQLENVPRTGPGGTVQTGTPPVTRIARGEGIQYDANGTPYRMQGSGRIEVAQPSQLDAPAPLNVRDIQRTVRPDGEPTDRAAANRDARTAASRAEFSQRVHGRPDPNAPVATPEQAARGAAAPGNYQQAREQLLSGYNRLVEDAKPRNVAAAVNDPRRDPRAETKWAESRGSTDSSSSGKGTSSVSKQRSSTTTPHTTVVQGAESHYVPDAAAQAVERERQQKAQAALTAYGPAPYERPGWHTDVNRPLPSSVHATGPIQSGQGAAPSDIPNKSVQDLINNPKLAAEFDTKYGVGASRRILGANQVRY